MQCNNCNVEMMIKSAVPFVEKNPATAKMVYICPKCGKNQEEEIVIDEATADLYR